MVDAVQQHVTTATHVKGVNGVTSNDTSGIANASAVAKVSDFPCTYIVLGQSLSRQSIGVSLFLVSSLSWGPSLVYDEKLETEALVCVLCRRVMQRSWCWGPTFRPHTRSVILKTQRHAFFLIKSTVICQDRLRTKGMGN